MNIQRVTQASVKVDKKILGSIKQGLLCFVCAMPEDTLETCSKAAKKIANLRMFSDETGKMNRSILDVGGSVLLVSQFTLAAETKKGNRPDFKNVLEPQKAKKLFYILKSELQKENIVIETGRFGSHMEIALVNDGPVTIPLEVK